MANNEQVAITTISIKYFRSIVSVNLELERLNMFVGLNDVGKSNVLKALNLFLMAKLIMVKSSIFQKISRNYFLRRVKKRRK